MSGCLSVTVALALDESDLSDGAKVVGNIYSADGNGVTHRNVLFPCGMSAVPARYEVDPGRYIVSATLPSGTVLSRDTEAREGEDTPVTLRTAPSPYASHSWQYLLGNIEAYENYHGSATIPVPRSRGSRSGVWEGLVQPGHAVFVGDPKPTSYHFDSMLKLADGPAERPTVFEIAQSAPRSVPSLALGDAAARLYRFGAHGPVDEQGTPIRWGGPTGPRQFLVVSLAGNEYVVTLPAPWGSAQIEVLVNERQSPTGSAVSVAVRDRRVGPALGYMSRGAFDAAATLVRDAEALLYAKMENPLAAVAGAYVLVGSELTERPQRWDPWLDHLRHEFDWMSDGSLLWAVRQLRRAHTETQLRAARDGLVESFDRGVPVFTLGLSRLIHGLSEFPDDPECARRLDQARRLSWRVDLREPFVIVALRGRPQ
ncbi:hypothetical protein [Streptomyces avermitilis]|uniref:hypothetical protein n=1 Tax=Streptomyces avermitilis TaxID=33903 RepID=UPI0033ABB744